MPFSWRNNHYVKQFIPEIDSLSLSKDGTTILQHVQGDNTGGGTRPLSDAALDRLLTGAGDPRVTGIGPKTLLRAIVTNMVEAGTPIAPHSVDHGLLDSNHEPLQRDHSGGDSSLGSLHRSGVQDAGLPKSKLKGILYLSSPESTGYPSRDPQRPSAAERMRRMADTYAKERAWEKANPTEAAFRRLMRERKIVPTKEDEEKRKFRAFLLGK